MSRQISTLESGKYKILALGRRLLREGAKKESSDPVIKRFQEGRQRGS